MAKEIWSADRAARSLLANLTQAPVLSGCLGRARKPKLYLFYVHSSLRQARIWRRKARRPHIEVGDLAITIVTEDGKWTDLHS